VATPRGSEEEGEEEEAIGAWLHVCELLVNLSQTVLVNCPTASVFLAVVLPGGVPPETIDDSMLKGVLAELHTVLSRITGRTQRAETVPLRAAALVGNLRALQRQLVDTKVDPPPATLTKEELSPPRHPGGSGDGLPARSIEQREEDSDQVLEEVMGLFEAAAELEGDAEWCSVTELDTADAPAVDSARPDWEFDGAAHRKKRQQAIERAEAERNAKRAKLAPAPRVEPRKEDPRSSESRRRREAEEEREKAAKRHAPESSQQAPKPAAAPAAAPTAQAAAPPQKAIAANAAEKKAAPAAGGVDAQSAAALQAFLKDHPHFMRVIQNPKKCLSDPRVKTMFLAELNNYPVVQKFLASKGLVLS